MAQFTDVEYWSAALITIAVFFGFTLGEDPGIKMMGLGLATAIFLDATVVASRLGAGHHEAVGRRQLVDFALASGAPDLDDARLQRVGDNRA
ncbi:MAG: hypothetical protein LH645_06760 [Actinomycetia bacterium]|nr:hypothetical protein [Actinomycetes bacterium]